MASENTVGSEGEGILRLWGGFVWSQTSPKGGFSLFSDSTGVSFEKVLKLDFHK